MKTNLVKHYDVLVDFVKDLSKHGLQRDANPKMLDPDVFSFHACMEAADESIRSRAQDILNEIEES